MGYVNMPDSVLIQHYIEGAEKALEVLILRHQSKIYGFIYSKLGDRDLTEDVFQETFIKVIHTLKTKKYNEEGKFLPWVIRIAHNLVIDHFRKAKKMPMLRETDHFSVFSFISDSEPNIESQLISNQTEVDLKKLIEQLPDDQREVLVMRIYQDLSFKEIAVLTDVSINTALGRMRYALMNIRKMVDVQNLVLME
ncbi:RNA polymerase sigma factor [Flavobacterium sp. JP2137]|uniref:RNA polymerase sigma factor n=1 Tax=Flavobacterium sp. JP2137 TaxID=3414510 RepID=UPI003D2FD61C